MKLLIAYVALTAASPVPERTGAPAQVPPLSPAAVRQQLETITAAQQAYGVWSAEVIGNFSEVNRALGEIQNSQMSQLGQPSAGRLASLRPQAAAFLALVDRAEAQLRATADPDVTGLVLPTELMPQRFRAETLASYGHVRVVMTSLVELLEAGAARQFDQIQSAGARMSAAMLGMLDGQMLFSRARMAALPEGSPARGVIGTELTGQELSRLVMASGGRATPTLARDLTALADRLQGWIDAGRASADRGTAQLEALPPRPAGSTEAAFVARQLRLLAGVRAELDTAPQLVALIRRLAVDAPTITDPRAMLAPMAEARAILARLDQQELELSAALAERR